jgi:hypothetical protein
VRPFFRYVFSPTAHPTTDTNRTRIVKKVKKTDSFFDFFTAPVPPTPEQLESGELDEELEDELEFKLQMDYQIAEDLKDRVRSAGSYSCLVVYYSISFR